MKQFENKVLLIKDEDMFNQVNEMINEHGKKTGVTFDWIDDENLKDDNFLYLNIFNKRFELGNKFGADQEITLDEFKELLKIK